MGSHRASRCRGLRLHVREQCPSAVLPRRGVRACDGSQGRRQHRQHQQHAGRIGLANGAAYGATKAALASLTQGWTAEYSPRGVRVNAVAAGPIYTRPEARELFDSLGATTAMNRAAQPEEIAGVIAFLASRQASYVTGAVIAADGGRTAI